MFSGRNLPLWKTLGDVIAVLTAHTIIATALVVSSFFSDSARGGSCGPGESW